MLNHLDSSIEKFKIRWEDGRVETCVCSANLRNPSAIAEGEFYSNLARCFTNPQLASISDDGKYLNIYSIGLEIGWR